MMKSSIKVSFGFESKFDPFKLSKYKTEFNEAEVNRLITRFDPDEVTRQLNITPTEICRAGDVDPINQKRFLIYDSWKVSTDDEYFNSLNKPLEKILKQIYPHASQISNIREKYDLQTYLSCAVNIRSGVQSDFIWEIEKEVIKMIADLDLSIDFDVYNWSSAEESEVE